MYYSECFYCITEVVDELFIYLILINLKTNYGQLIFYKKKQILNPILWEVWVLNINKNININKYEYYF